MASRISKPEFRIFKKHSASQKKSSVYFFMLYHQDRLKQNIVKIQISKLGILKKLRTWGEQPSLIKYYLLAGLCLMCNDYQLTRQTSTQFS